MGETQIETIAGDKDLRRFIEFPYQLYSQDPHWVPPLRIQQRDLLNTSKHPFYRHGSVQHFLATDKGRTVGRVSAILEKSAAAVQTGHFGFFECVDSEEVATKLLDTARRWLIERGVRRILGPVNPSTNYECGLLVEGFDSSPYVMMTYNPPSYARLIERAGFRKAKDLLAYGGSVAQVDGAKARRVAARDKSVEIRPIRMKQFEQEVETIWKIYNSAWSQNWGFAPMPAEEFQFMARDMKQIVDPNLALVGHCKGQPVGFALALPDINQALKPAGGSLFPLGLFKILYHKSKIRSLRVLALGVIERYRTAAVAAAFYAALIDQARKAGYQHCEFSWVLEDNILMNRSIEALGVSRYKTYRIYEWTQNHV